MNSGILHLGACELGSLVTYFLLFWLTVVRIHLLFLELWGIPKAKSVANLGVWMSKSMQSHDHWSNICPISSIATGVCQLVNKMEENTGKVKPFNRNDEQFLEAFVIFCGLGIQNTQMYEAVERAMAKQMVTLEVSWSL